MTLDELRRLNPRDIGTWPALPKLGALLLLLIALLVAGFFLDWSNQWDELKGARGKEDNLRSQFLDKKRQAIIWRLIASSWPTSSSPSAPC